MVELYSNFLLFFLRDSDGSFSKNVLTGGVLRALGRFFKGLLIGCGDGLPGL